MINLYNTFLNTYVYYFFKSYRTNSFRIRTFGILKNLKWISIVTNYLTNTWLMTATGNCSSVSSSKWIHYNCVTNLRLLDAIWYYYKPTALRCFKTRWNIHELWQHIWLRALRNSVEKLIIQRHPEIEEVREMVS